MSEHTKSQGYSASQETDDLIELVLHPGASAKTDASGKVVGRYRYSRSDRHALIALSEWLIMNEVTSINLACHPASSLVPNVWTCRATGREWDRETRGLGEEWECEGEARSDECKYPLALAICRMLLNIIPSEEGGDPIAELRAQREAVMAMISQRKATK